MAALVTREVFILKRESSWRTDGISKVDIILLNYYTQQTNRRKHKFNITVGADHQTGRHPV